jgi:hypothetical protein
VRVAIRKAIAGRDALVAQARLLELERLGRRTELQVRRAVEPRADVLQILLDVPQRERYGAILGHRAEHAIALRNFAGARTVHDYQPQVKHPSAPARRSVTPALLRTPHPAKVRAKLLRSRVVK